MGKQGFPGEQGAPGRQGDDGPMGEQGNFNFINQLFYPIFKVTVVDAVCQVALVKRVNQV